jgi:HrpA-like RNA helicase
MPTLNEFDNDINDKPINIIMKTLKDKLDRGGKENKVLFLKAMTGSGKSTFMISYLFDNLVKDEFHRILISEPRTILPVSNVNDILRYNSSYRLGGVIGYITGVEKIYPSEPSAILFMTTQLLQDLLLRALSTPVLLYKFRLIVIDEVHTLDLPMMLLLKTIKEILDKFSTLAECPIFIFTSATIDVEKMQKYYGIDDEKSIITVKGALNHPVEKIFINEQLYRSYIEREKRGQHFGELIGEYFMNNFYDKLDNSKSFIKAKLERSDDIQCRDVLIFLPLAMAIDKCGSYIEKRITNVPKLFVKMGMDYSAVEEWRKTYADQKRVLIIGFGRNYSTAADQLLSIPMDSENNVKYETKIIISTPIIESGKTISTVSLCIDSGLNTSTFYIPLTYDFNKFYINTVAINRNQLTQRVGRVGRETEGTFIHFYTESIMNKFRLGDIPETINTPCISPQLIEIMKMKTTIDLFKENNFLFPVSLDGMIISYFDLLKSSFIDHEGNIPEMKLNWNWNDAWLFFVRYLVKDYKMKLFDAILLASINQKNVPPFISLTGFDKDKLRFKDIESLPINNDNILRIRAGRNLFTLLKYSQKISF